MSFSSSPIIGRAIKSGAESLLHTGSSSGIENKIFDAVKSLVTLLMTWDQHLLTGKLALSSIMNLKESLGWKLDNLPAGPKLDSLLEVCHNLGSAVDGMVHVADDMQTLAHQIAVLSKLDQFQAQKSARIPVFPSATWDCIKFGAVFQNISDAFHEEVKMRIIVKGEAAQSPDKNTLTSYIARWNNPGFLNNKVTMLIIGLLSELSLATL